jgi:hypothetical protein
MYIIYSAPEIYGYLFKTSLVGTYDNSPRDGPPKDGSESALRA